jgi:hypothetical protein
MIKKNNIKKDPKVNIEIIKQLKNKEIINE